MKDQTGKAVNGEEKEEKKRKLSKEELENLITDEDLFHMGLR
jgi:hypothetical protein